MLVFLWALFIFWTFLLIKDLEYTYMQYRYVNSVWVYKEEIERNTKIVNELESLRSIENFFKLQLEKQYENTWYVYIRSQIVLTENFYVFRLFYSLPNAVGFQTEKYQDFIFGANGVLQS